MNKQKIILAGGGDAEESYLVDELFKDILPSKSFLFLPQAISPEIWSYEKSFEWIGKPKAFKDFNITMWKEIKNVTLNELLEYEAIYLMGGNTFKLLKCLRDTHMFELLKDYLNHGKTIYGISAGAIIMGRHIKTAALGPEKDENLVSLKDFTSLDLLNGAIVLTHYNEEVDQELFEMSKNDGKKIICIPETSGILVEELICSVIGPDSVVVIDFPNKNSFEKGSSFQI